MRHFKTVSVGVLRGAFSCTALGLAIHLIGFHIPPSPSTHPIDRANDIENKMTRFVPYAAIITAGCAIAGALAGFSSAFPPQPLSFARCLMIIVVIAGIARIVSSPSPKSVDLWYDNLSYFVTVGGAVVGCLIAMWIGFKDPAERQDVHVQPEYGC